jgi:hypothetical protein
MNLTCPTIIRICTLIVLICKRENHSGGWTQQGTWEQGDLLELMRRDDEIAKEEKNWMHDNVKEDDGGDNRHKTKTAAL